jgi:hypothetical protein
MTESSKNNGMCLAEEIPNIFESLRPALIKIAIGYRVPDARAYVNEWQAKAFFIAKKFDDGVLQTKQVAEGGIGGLVQTSEADIDFLKVFKAYLKIAFKNDLNRDYSSRKRTKFIADLVDKSSGGSTGDDANSSMSDYICGAVPADADITADCGTIPDLLHIVCGDIDAAKESAIFAVDLANVAFLEALRLALLNLGQYWRDEPVIPYIGREENKDYFDSEFRDMLTPRVLFYMAQSALLEPSPAVASRISDVCLSHAGMAIQRRMYRYFFNYNGGLQNRIPRSRLGKGRK